MKIGILGAGGDISSGQYLARLYKGYPEAEFLAFEPSDNPEVFAKVQETILKSLQKFRKQSLK
jgi:hypothetical protein